MKICASIIPFAAPLAKVRSESGIALLIVLWVMTLLIVISLSFSVMARTEIFSTMTYRDQVGNKYLAEAGLQRGIMELFYRSANMNSTVELAGREIYRVDGKFYIGQMDKGYYKFSLLDESGKININTLTDLSGIILNNLLVNLGIGKEEADTIVDSILDWKDPDDATRLHGAESDYYMSLPEPYKAKDADFDNLEELLLVKGVTPEILYGREDRPGIINFLTVYSNTDKINVKAAAPEVLKAIPFMSDDTVQKILTYRSADNTRQDGTDLQAILAGDLAKISPYITTADSAVYAVEALGYREKENDKKGYPLKAIVMVDGTGHYRILYYQSPAKIRPS